MPKQPMSDVIVLIPGITGSVLQRNGKDVWAVTKGAIFNAFRTLGKSLEEIEIKGEDDPEKKAFLVGRIQLSDGKVIKLILPPQQPHPKVGDRVPLIYERYDDGQAYYFFNTLSWVSNAGMP